MAATGLSVIAGWRADDAPVFRLFPPASACAELGGRSTAWFGGLLHLGGDDHLGVARLSSTRRRLELVRPIRAKDRPLRHHGHARGRRVDLSVQRTEDVERPEVRRRRARRSVEPGRVATRRGRPALEPSQRSAKPRRRQRHAAPRESVAFRRPTRPDDAGCARPRHRPQSMGVRAVKVCYRGVVVSPFSLVRRIDSPPWAFPP